MDATTAQRTARETFATATTDQVKTVWVSTVVQTDRFTEREARDIRRWAVQEIAAREGEQAAADFVSEMIAAA